MRVIKRDDMVLRENSTKKKKTLWFPELWSQK